MTRRTSTALSLLAVLTLCACGGSDGGLPDPGPYTPDSTLFANGGLSATLDVVALDRSTGNVGATTTQLTAPNQLIGGGLAGTVNYVYVTGASNTISLSSGKMASLEDNGTRYAFRFGNADQIGIAGIPASIVPGSGTATYTGFADVSANDGSATPKLLTNSSTTASFGTGRVNVYLNNAQGDWIRINDAIISGNTYADGTMTVSSSFATDPGLTSGSLQHEGRFFEQNAKEIGGVLILDRTSAGIDFKVQGVYGGNDGS